MTAGPAPRSSPGVLGRILEVVPTGLALLAEAAWVSILAGMLQAFTLRPPVVGYGWFLAAAVAGLVAARVLPDRAGERWPVVAAVLAVAAGAAAWLSAADVRSLLAAGTTASIGPALAANLAGWLAAVAFVRGIAHARLPADPRRIGNLLGLAIPGLAATAIVGGMVAEPARGSFLAEAQAEVLVFLVAGVLALALARLGLVATGAAVDWRRNPAWLALLLTLLAGTALLAVGVSLFAGQVIVLAMGALFAPLLIVGFLVGFDRRSLGILLLSLTGAAGIAVLVQLFAARGTVEPSTPGSVPGAATDPGAVTQVTVGVLGIVLLVAVAALLVLARLWLRRPHDEESLVPETREIDRGELDGPRSRRAGWSLVRRPPAPRDAVAAYRTLMRDLDAHPAVRRADGETPAEHAARLRIEGRTGLDLDLLAADYGLARYGGVPLSPREDRRALRRLATLRARLLRG